MDGGGESARFTKAWIGGGGGQKGRVRWSEGAREGGEIKGDKQTDRQTYRQTDRQTDREKEINRERERGSNTAANFIKISFSSHTCSSTPEPLR